MPVQKKTSAKRRRARRLTIDVTTLRQSTVKQCPLADIEGQWYTLAGTSFAASKEHKLLWKVIRIDKDANGNPTKAWVQLYGESTPTSVSPYIEVHPYLS